MPLLSAKVDNATYNCPPEVSDFLLVERERLLQRLRQLESRERELKLLEKKIEEQINALTQLSVEVDEKLKKISAIQDERVKLLVKAYAEMRPAKAAQQLMNMDREMAVKILSQLKSTQVASILSAMPPEKAASLAEALSGYPPKEY
uniref:Magnesium transporter MgtE intracellular domain-containing protein n=1 Tax=Caldimicrobium thiodismutans TaxID=1653476 RepID=A0A832LWF9_9BACT